MAREDGGLRGGRGEDEVLAEVVGVAAFGGRGLEGGGEGFVEGEDVFELGNKWGYWDVGGEGGLGVEAVEDEHSREVVGRCVVAVEHAARDVGDVHAAVGGAGNVDLVALEGEGGDEVFPEAEELLGDVELRGGGWGALGEAGADGLVDPDDVGEVVPAPFVGEGPEDAGLPEEGPVGLG